MSKNITTTHNEIGYTNNVEIIERALRETFGIDDASHMMTALAAHVWSQIAGLGVTKMNWGEAEIERAFEQLKGRLDHMTKTFSLRKATNAVAA